MLNQPCNPVGRCYDREALLEYVSSPNPLVLGGIDYLLNFFYSQRDDSARNIICSSFPTRSTPFPCFQRAM